jgi:hypothetical protein
VRASLGRPTARVTAWDATPLRGGATKTPLWRLSGRAAVPAVDSLDAVDAENAIHAGNSGASGDLSIVAIPWSVALKAKSHDDARDGAVPEVEAYRSGLLDQVTQEGFGLAAPRCYIVEPGPPAKPGDDPTTYLWLEDVAERPAGAWSLDRYGLAAYHLGLFNGALPRGRSRGAPPPAFEVPAYPWLGSGFLDYWLEMMGDSWALGRTILSETTEDHAAWEHPLIAAHFSRDTRARLQRAWGSRHQLHASLKRLPRTLAHGDAHRRNLISQRMADGGDRTVAVDWAVIGYAPLGEDPGHLTTSSLLFEDDSTRARELDAAVFERYLEGLEEAGWRLTRRLCDTIRFGYAAHGLLNMGLFAGGGAVAAVARPWIRRWYESVLNRPLEDLMPRLAATTHFCLDLGDEATALGERPNLLRP